MYMRNNRRGYSSFIMNSHIKSGYYMYRESLKSLIPHDITGYLIMLKLCDMMCSEHYIT